MEHNREQLHQALVASFEKSGLNLSALSPSELAEKINSFLESIDESAADKHAAPLFWLVTGFGPLEPLLQDDTITEILVNGPEQIYIERNGRLEKSDRVFSSLSELKNIIGRMASLAGRRIDTAQPYVDARLADGSRINAIIPPLSRPWPILTIRKFARQMFTLLDLVKMQTMSNQMAEFLKSAVLARQNILISGSTGAGKTSLLNALAAAVPASERLIVIEDTAEIKLNHPHLVTLEARQSNMEGKGEVSIRALLRNALRMRPDRVIIGEVRGGEALDMLQAMNTGHQGAVTTIHANAPHEALLRLETMAMMTDIEMPLLAIREQINMAIRYILQIERLPSGERKMVALSELIKRPREAEYLVKPLFIYDKTRQEFKTA